MATANEIPGLPDGQPFVNDNTIQGYYTGTNFDGLSAALSAQLYARQAKSLQQKVQNIALNADLTDPQQSAQFAVAMDGYASAMGQLAELIKQIHQVQQQIIQAV
jgi:hypothetical protein